VPDVTASTARYPYEVTLHQGEIESLFLDSMRKDGLEVERPIVPVSLQMSEDPTEIADPHAYPVKVRHFPDLPTCCATVNLFVHTRRSC
jgi:phenol 2-monooxygenase (NADPH)